MKHFVATKGKFTLNYSDTYDAQSKMKKLDFIQKKNLAKGFPEIVSFNQNAGIAQDKKDDVINKPSSLMPPSRRNFWLNMPVVPESSKKNKQSKRDSTRSLKKVEY